MSKTNKENPNSKKHKALKQDGVYACPKCEDGIVTVGLQHNDPVFVCDKCGEYWFG